MIEKIAKFFKTPFVCTALAVVLGFMVACGILLVTGYSASQSLAIMINSIFSRPKFIVNVILKSTPIILTALSVTFAFKTGLFNIGAEGQYIAATIASTIVGITFNFHPVIQIPLVIFSGMLAGAIFGGIVGFLKSKFGINEVLTSIMLNWIAFYLCNYVVTLEAFHKPESDGTFPINPSGFTLFLNDWKFSDAGREFLRSNPFLNDVILKTDFNLNFIIAVLMAVLTWVILYKKKKGYEFRVAGISPDAAENAGINVQRNILYTMMIAGALSGLAGALSITGTSIHGIQTLAVFENYGFNGLSVALIAGSSPIGCIFSGLMFSGLIYSGQSLQFKIGVPSEIVNIMIGIIVFFVALVRIIPSFINKFLEKREKLNAK